MSKQKSKRLKPQGKIIKTKTGYKVKAIAVYYLTAFSIEPRKITLLDSGVWIRTTCCICGINFRPYTPQPVIMLYGHFHNICDDCLKTNCPELYTELMKRQAEFDKEMGYDKEEKTIESYPDDPF